MDYLQAFSFGIAAFKTGLDCKPQVDKKFQDSLPAASLTIWAKESRSPCLSCGHRLYIPIVEQEEPRLSETPITCISCGDITSVSVLLLYDGEAKLNRAWRAGWLSAEALDAARKAVE